MDKLCPTKRLLNTFREVCSQTEGEAKYVPQDRSDCCVKINLKKRQNIFSEARKEI